MFNNYLIILRPKHWIKNLLIFFPVLFSPFQLENFAIQNANVYHRGTNKVIVNPIQTLRGSVLSTGDLISVNRPPIVEVEETYTGRLIFE